MIWLLKEEEIGELLNDKEGQNTQKACKDRNLIYFQVSNNMLELKFAVN